MKKEQQLQQEVQTIEQAMPTGDGTAAQTMEQAGQEACLDAVVQLLLTDATKVLLVREHWKVDLGELVKGLPGRGRPLESDAQGDGGVPGSAGAPLSASDLVPHPARVPTPPWARTLGESPWSGAWTYLFRSSARAAGGGPPGFRHRGGLSSKRRAILRPQRLLSRTERRAV